MSADEIRSKAFEWACDYEPWDENLEYSKHAEEGYVQGYLQAKRDLERQLEEAREDELSFLNMHIMAYIYPSSTCEIYASVCKRIKELKEKGDER